MTDRKPADWFDPMFKPQFRIETLPGWDNKFRVLFNGQEVHGVDAAHVDVQYGTPHPTDKDPWRYTTLTLTLCGPVEQVEHDYVADENGN